MYAFFQQMRGSNAISLNNDRALRARLKIDTLRAEIQIPPVTSGMLTSVDEEGTSSYTVAAGGDEILLITANDGLTYKVWAYNNL